MSGAGRRGQKSSFPTMPPARCPRRTGREGGGNAVEAAATPWLVRGAGAARSSVLQAARAPHECQRERGERRFAELLDAPAPWWAVSARPGPFVGGKTTGFKRPNLPIHRTGLWAGPGTRLSPSANGASQCSRACGASDAWIRSCGLRIDPGEPNRFPPRPDVALVGGRPADLRPLPLPPPASPPFNNRKRPLARRTSLVRHRRLARRSPASAAQPAGRVPQGRCWRRPPPGTEIFVDEVTHSGFCLRALAFPVLKNRGPTLPLRPG